jgi:hypothetical protein
MEKFKFHYQWIKDEECGCPEEVATWARIGLEVDGKQVFYHQDLLSGEKRETQLLPLIDLANWFAGNYWFLLGESLDLDCLNETEYAYRHGLRFASQGFPLPSLTFFSEREFIQLEWKVSEEVHAQIKYLRPDSAKIPTEIFTSELNAFLNAVDGKLQASGIQDTEFQDLWASIKAADSEEGEFCIAAAAIGKDPYSINDSEANEIVTAAEILPDGLYVEFLNAIGTGFTLKKAKTIQRMLGQLSASHSDSSPKGVIADSFNNLHASKPWEAGYQAAKELRRNLRLKNGVPISYDALLENLGVETGNSITGNYFDLNGSSEKVHVLITSNSDKRPSLAYSKWFKRNTPEFRESNEKFAFCRAIFEYFYNPNKPALVTSSHLSSQKRNRAFAAEFLAPAEGIENMIKGKTSISEEEVQSIAYQFKVSAWIVKHQIENNQLAKIKSQF